MIIKYCTIANTGNKIICHDNPTPPNKQNNIIMIDDIKKFTNPLVATDIGSISLGKYTFLIIPSLTLIVIIP